jgi:hypothetical protein
MIKQAGFIALVGLGLTISAVAEAQTSKRTELTRRSDRHEYGSHRWRRRSAARRRWGATYSSG